MKLLSAITTAVQLAFLPAAIIAHPFYDRREDTNLSTDSYIPVKAPYVNIFSSLTVDETTSISNFVGNLSNGTVPEDCYIDLIERLLPNKTDALLYLNGSGPQPPKYAKVSIQCDCYVREYMFGPISPLNNYTAANVTPLNYIYGGNGTQDNLWCISSGHFGDGGLGSPYDESQNRTNETLPADDRAAPLVVLPGGARHYFDSTQNYVSWMDFSLFATVGRTGLALYDIRFKGERIVYELAMQEALAHYAGVNQDAAQTAYLDASIDFTPGKLVPGYDCPSYATYGSEHQFCLFEFPKDYPIQRHTGDSYHVTKNIAFMLRAVSTVGNYDYQITYEFHLDGSIQVVARASGYIAWTDWTNSPLDPSYGFHIRHNMSGSMHDHVLNWKIDLDIKGTANSLFKSQFVPVSTTYPWSNGTTVNTMKVDRSFVTNEDQGKIDWGQNADTAYSVVNKDQPNLYGEYPGYRIYPSIGASIHSTIVNSSLMGQTINWATHTLYALQRKDSEPVSADKYAIYNIDHPRVNFNDFFDGESLEQEDLVLYVNLGMHHMPDTSDLPTTVFTNAQSGIMLRPQNYLLSDASRATRQQVDISYEDVVNQYGQTLPEGSFDLTKTNPDLEALFADDEA